MSKKDDKGPEKPLEEEDIFLPVESTLELSDLIEEGNRQAVFTEPDEDATSESEPIDPFSPTKVKNSTTKPEPLPTVGPAIEEVTDNVSIHEADILLNGYLSMERRTKSRSGDKPASKQQEKKLAKLRLSGVPRNKKFAHPETGQQMLPPLERQPKPKQQHSAPLQTPKQASKKTRRQGKRRTDGRPVMDTSDWPVLDADIVSVTTETPSRSSSRPNPQTVPSREKTPKQPSMVAVKPGPREKEPAAKNPKTPQKRLRNAPPLKKQDSHPKPAQETKPSKETKPTAQPVRKAQPTKKGDQRKTEEEKKPHSSGSQKPPAASIRRKKRPQTRVPSDVPKHSRARPDQLKSSRFEPQDAPTMEAPRTQAEKLKEQFAVSPQEEPTKVVDHKKTLEIFKEFAATQRPKKDK